MNLWIDNVRERDLDVLLLGLFSSNPSTLSVFLGGDTSDVQIISLSLDTRKNSSLEAITIIVEQKNKRTVLLIADLIMDVLKEGQAERFKAAGKKYLTEGKADKYRCCVISPRNYIEKNQEQLGNLHCVSYETIADLLKGNPYLSYMFTRAIEERKRTYSEKTNRQIVEFWKQYYTHVRKVFPDLSMKRFSEKSGFQTMTASFMTKVPGVPIYHNTEEGLVGVIVKLGSFSYAEISETMKPYLFAGMSIRQYRSNALFCMDVPVINFRGNFDEQIPKLDKALEAVVEMQEFINELDYGRFEQIMLGDAYIEDQND